MTHRSKKTRPILLGRFGSIQRAEQGVDKSETFNRLHWTFTCNITSFCQ
jgi:hypothetical protein